MDAGGGRPRPPRRRVDGVLLLDKPAGLTSNAALQRAKRAYAAEKAGHTGTLDPLATGLLPLCFGDATKFAQAVLDAPKEYVATVRFGTATTTGDAEGETVRSCDVAFSRAELVSALTRFVGPIVQTPPAFAALKFRGRNYYEYARAGIDIPRVPRAIEIGADRARRLVAAARRVAGRVQQGHVPARAGRGHCRRSGLLRAPRRIAADRLGTVCARRRRDAGGTRGDGRPGARRAAAARPTRRSPGSRGSTWTSRPRGISPRGARDARRLKCPEGAAATARRGGFSEWSKRSAGNCARCGWCARTRPADARRGARRRVVRARRISA